MWVLAKLVINLLLLCSAFGSMVHNWTEVWQHDNITTTVSFTPDGKTFVIGGYHIYQFRLPENNYEDDIEYMESIRGLFNEGHIRKASALTISKNSQVIAFVGNYPRIYYSFVKGMKTNTIKYLGIMGNGSDIDISFKD